MDMQTCKTVIDWAATGSLLSAVGTFAAAGVALFIWLKDRSRSKNEKAAQARSLAILLFGELYNCVMKAQVTHENVIKAKSRFPQFVNECSHKPSILADGLKLISSMRTPRLERLIEIQGILPHTATVALSDFLVSLTAVEELRSSLHASSEKGQKVSAEDVKAGINCIKELHVSTRVAYLQMARTMGCTEAQIRDLVAKLDATSND